MMMNRNLARFLTLSVLAIAAIFSLSKNTKATELLTNGGFETGIVGWTEINDNAAFPSQRYVFSVGAGQSLFENSNNIIQSPYLHRSFAQEGSRTAMMALFCNGVPTVTTRFFQNITIPAGNNLTLSWRQRFSQNNGAALSDDDVVAKVVIRNTSDVIVQTLYTKTLNNQTDEVFPWTTHSVNLGNTYAGQTIRVEFQATVFDANAPNYFTNRGLWEIDAVSANAAPPTAAGVAISGRVKTETGEAIIKARVILADMDGNVRSVFTNKFGYYRFEDLPAGLSYIIVATKNGQVFNNVPRLLGVNEDIEEEDFIAVSRKKE